MSEFSGWLSSRLNEEGLDGDVFGDYIASTLDDMADSSSDEKMASLSELLSGAMVRHDTHVTLTACVCVGEL